MGRASRVLAPGAIAVLATACFRAEIDLTVSADNTISGTALLAYERAGLEELDRNPGDAQDELLADLEFDRPEGMTCAAWDDDKYIGARCDLEQVTFDAFSLTDTFQQEIAIVREGDRIRLFGVINLGDVPVGNPELIDAFDVQIRVTFPGQVISQQNGTVDGQTVTWSLPPGELTEIGAVAEAGPGAGNEVPWAPVIGVLLAVTLVALVLAVRRRSGTPKSAD
ncbi:MAG: LppM family (lipo)protein [Candidatus Limnocylindria bacterium]